MLKCKKKKITNHQKMLIDKWSKVYFASDDYNLTIKDYAIDYILYGQAIIEIPITKK